MNSVVATFLYKRFDKAHLSVVRVEGKLPCSPVYLWGKLKI